VVPPGAKGLLEAARAAESLLQSRHRAVAEPLQERPREGSGVVEQAGLWVRNSPHWNTYIYGLDAHV